MMIEKKRAWKIVLVFFSAAITLLLVEIGFRVTAYVEDLKTLESLHNRPKLKRAQTRYLADIIRVSKNPKIIYELLPDLSIRFKGGKVTTNSLGFRVTPLRQKAKGPHIAIAGIGDSVMFGWGVNDNEAYLSLLSTSLNHSYRSYIWDIYNMAVPGYNSVMEVETLREKGLKFDPAIVIIHFVENDTDLPNFIREHENYFALNQSFLIRYLSAGFRRAAMISSPRDLEESRFENDPHRVPEQYKSMVGEQAVLGAMKELQLMSRANGFEVILLTHADFPTWLRQAASGLSFHMIAVAPAWQQYAKEHNIEDRRAAWSLNKDDPHPSVLGHQVIEATLEKYLTEKGILQQVMQN